MGAANESVSGVLVTWTRKAFNEQISNWTKFGQKYSVTYKNGDPVPGGIYVRLNQTGKTIFKTDPQNTRETNLSSTSTGVTPFFFEFPTLGTYTVGFIVDATHTDTNVYSDTGSYTIHVGPIAELEVQDGGRNPAVPAGQRAYTIMAVNNGPDVAPAVKVTLTNLDEPSCTAGTPTKGTIAFASSECTWTISELITKDISQITNGRDGEVLTISTSASAAEGTEITAAISNTQDYEKCIDSSGNDVAHNTESDCTSGTTALSTTGTWHTAKYYDYISDNNSATIASRQGIQGVATLTVTERADKVTLSWPAQTTLTDGSPVTSYGLLVSGDGGATWQVLASRIRGTSHSAPSGALPFGNTRHYAVFALNQAGDQDLPFATAVVEDVVVRTNTVTRTETVVQTETVVETQTVVQTVNVPVPYFAGDGTTRTTARNIAPGSPVGAPVTVVKDPRQRGRLRLLPGRPRRGPVHHRAGHGTDSGGRGRPPGLRVRYRQLHRGGGGHRSQLRRERQDHRHHRRGRRRV